MGLLAMGCSAQDSGVLQGKLSDIVARHHGKVALYAMQLKQNGGMEEVGMSENDVVQTASVIKLAILYEAMVEVREGKAHWDEKIVLKKDDQVGGSGMLHFFDAPLSLTLKDVLTFMIITSDNTATNLAIDRFGIDPVNARVETSLGLKNTHLYKKVFKPATGPLPADQPKYGLGKTTPKEMAQLLTHIGECHLRPESPDRRPVPAGGFKPMDDQDKAVCTVALDMLKSQFYRETIPRYLPGGGEGATASKTGSLNQVRNDVALVTGKSGPMVISIFTYDNTDQGWTVDNEGEVTIAKLGKAIVDAWSPAGLDPKSMAPGLGLGK